MRNINKISPKAYFYFTVIFAAVSMVYYRSALFRCIYTHTYDESYTILIVIWAVCHFLSYLLTRKRRRNYLSLFTNTVLPLGIYSLIVYERAHPVVVLAIEIAIYVLGGAYCVAVLARRIKADDSTVSRKVIMNRFKACLNGLRTVTAVCCSVLIIYTLCLNAFDSPSVIPAVKPTADVVETKQEVLADNLPVISGIDPSVWKTLTFDERIDVMQTLANVERVQLGIGHEINLCADSLGFGTYGTYAHATHTVTLNFDILEMDNPYKCVETLCHETRHAFQRNVSEAYLSLDKDYQQLAIFDNARDYYENFDDYKDAYEDGFSEYEDQTVEADSRRYSRDRALFYFSVAELYLKEAA